MESKESDKSMVQTHPQPENAYISEKWIVLIINDLHQKTHENTGNKPEINNKPNMTTEDQYIIPNQRNRKNQINQRFRQSHNQKTPTYRKSE